MLEADLTLRHFALCLGPGQHRVAAMASGFPRVGLSLMPRELTDPRPPGDPGEGPCLIQAGRYPAKASFGIVAFFSV